MNHDTHEIRAASFALFAAVGAILTTALHAHALVALGPASRTDPQIFADGMVLQREMAAPIFGGADPGEQVTVTFNGQLKMTNADTNGRWRVDLDAMAAGGPYVLTAAGATNTAVVSDVMVGEVWVASGQSNMVIVRVPTLELAAHPEVRVFYKRSWNGHPGTVPWLFAKELAQELGCTVAIINQAIGGSYIKSWLAPSVYDDPDPELAALLAVTRDVGRYYDQFIAPLQPFAIRGVVWWQGEAEDRAPAPHREFFPALIRSWRLEWGQGNFPFIYVQVPTGRGLPFGQPVDPYPVPLNASATDRHAFRRHSFLIGLTEPKTSMVLTHDLVGGTHPTDRASYSHRLVLHVLAKAYGQNLVYSGPLLASHSIEGSSIRIRFRAGTAEGLQAGGGPLQGFAVSADGDTWHWADAVIEGNEVVVSSPAVPSPVLARYAWGNRPTWANLFNGAGLAAGQFATDVTPLDYGDLP
jgi:sialate O-acetylesterase